MEIKWIKNTTCYIAIPMVDSATPASFKTGLSPADDAYYKDGSGSWTALAITDTFAEIGSTGLYEITLTAAEMNHDQIVIKVTASGAADTMIIINCEQPDANIWYVAKDGSDGNHGHTRATAKLTISAAVTAAASGDTIIIQPGTYTENVDLNGKAIHLIGMSRAGVLITNTSGAIVTLATGCILENLSVTTTTVTGSDDIAVYGYNATNFHIKNCDIRGGYDGLYCASGTQNFTVDNCYIFGKFDGGNAASATDYQFRNCIFESDGTYGTSVDAKGYHGGGYGQFDNCIFIARRSDTSAAKCGGFEMTASGKIVMNNCIAVISAGSGHTGIAFGFAVTNSSARLMLNGGLASKSSANGTGGDLYQSAGILDESGCSYETTEGTITNRVNDTVDDIDFKTDKLFANPGSAFIRADNAAGSGWTDIENTYDDDDETCAEDVVGAEGAGDAITFTLPDNSYIDAIKALAGSTGGENEIFIQVETYDGSEWTTRRTFTPITNDTWFELELGEWLQVTQVRIAYYNNDTESHTVSLYDIQVNRSNDEAEDLSLAAKVIIGKAVQNKSTGAIVYYDDDGVTPILTHTPADGSSQITRTPS